MSQRQTKRKRAVKRARQKRYDAREGERWLGLMRERGWPVVDRRTFLEGLGMLTPAALIMDAFELLERLVPGAGRGRSNFGKESAFGARVHAETPDDLAALLRDRYGDAKVDALHARTGAGIRFDVTGRIMGSS